MRWAPMVLLLFIFLGCRTLVYVPVPAVSLDSTYVSRGVRDTVFIHDSVVVSERGDTVVKERARIIYRTRRVTDTVVSKRVDTLTVVVPAEREDSGVPVRLRWMGWGALVAVVLSAFLFWRRR